ncbi:hypothetical protein LY01_01844 [Nonlabens xylanidelens]|uniref:GDSL-like lipase/acylhydrolase family protein n=1 Tax=Nonlabens xylanidelens TaxID=191564 RepID=A0A2S6ILN8_9FLAO|nr:hypothetical protein LY01_01844 [Nonlabens xylanidelens]PQJ17621.1 hypothetical protein BST94_11275 [Nonlabens xylanidelens]
MKGFFKHISILILMLSIGVVILNNLYDNVFLNTSPRGKLQLAIKQEQEHIDYLFLGNSRVENYIDCSIIEAASGKICKNYAMSGSSYQDAYVLLKLLKRSGLTYDNLFIQLDPSLKNEAMTESFRASLVPFVNSYEIQIDHVALNLSPAEDHLPFYKYAKYDYLYGVRACFAQLYKNTSEYVELGYVPQYHTGNSNFGMLEDFALKNRFTELIKEEAVNDKAKIHFFTSPYCPDMDNTVVFNKLTSFYPGYINYSSFYKESHYFANCTHMNDKGAQVFTKQIIKDFNL